jgi:hypothetical protein
MDQDIVRNTNTLEESDANDRRDEVIGLLEAAWERFLAEEIPIAEAA